jgi:hypothetical protein
MTTDSPSFIVENSRGFIFINCVFDDDDYDYYSLEFSTRDEVESLITKLRAEMDKVWPDGVDEKEVQEKINEDLNLARNPNTSLVTLDCLARNKEWNVRELVAKNPNTSPETLARLADDENKSVRFNAAGNPNTPPEVLARLADDKDGDVRSFVARNPNTPPETLARLADEECWVRCGVAQNPNTPPETLARLSNDEYISVRGTAKSNPNYRHYQSKQ